MLGVNVLRRSNNETIYLRHASGTSDAIVVQEVGLSSIIGEHTEFRGKESSLGVRFLTTLNTHTKGDIRAFHYEYYPGDVLTDFLLNTRAVTLLRKLRIALELSFLVSDLINIDAFIFDSDYVLVSSKGEVKAFDLSRFTNPSVAKRDAFGSQSLSSSFGIALLELLGEKNNLGENTPLNIRRNIRSRLNRPISGFEKLDSIINRLVSSKVRNASLQGSVKELVATLYSSIADALNISQRPDNIFMGVAGRGQALVLMEDAFSDAAQGQKTLILVTGKGKRSLIYDSLTRYAPENSIYIWAKHDTYESMTPTLPILDAFKSRLHQLFTALGESEFKTLFSDSLEDSYTILLNWTTGKKHDDIVISNDGIIYLLQRVIIALSCESKPFVMVIDNYDRSHSFTKSFIESTLHNKECKYLACILTGTSESGWNNSVNEGNIVNVRSDNFTVCETVEALNLLTPIQFENKRSAAQDIHSITSGDPRRTYEAIVSLRSFVDPGEKLESDELIKGIQRFRRRHEADETLSLSPLNRRLLTYLSLLGGNVQMRTLLLLKISCEKELSSSLNELSALNIISRSNSSKLVLLKNDNLINQLLKSTDAETISNYHRNIADCIVHDIDNDTECRNAIVLGYHSSRSMNSRTPASTYIKAGNLAHHRFDRALAQRFFSLAIDAYLSCSADDAHLDLLHSAYKKLLLSAYITADLSLIDKTLDCAKDHITNIDDMADLYQYKIQCLASNDNTLLALQSGMTFLFSNGLSVSIKKPNDLTLIFEYLITKIDFFTLGNNTEGVKRRERALVTILSAMVDSAFIFNPALGTRYGFRLARLSRSTNPGTQSEVGFTSYSIFDICVLRRYHNAQYVYDRFHQLVASSPIEDPLRPWSSLFIESFVARLLVPLHTTLPKLESVVLKSLSAGNSRAASYALFTYGFNALSAGMQLTELYMRYTKLKAKIINLNMSKPKALINIIEAVCISLISGAPDIDEVSSRELLDASIHQKDNMAVCAISFFRAFLAIHCGHYKKSLVLSKLGFNNIKSIIGSEGEVSFLYYRAISALAINNKQYSGAIKSTYKLISKASKFAPFNYEHRMTHIEGELMNQRGDTMNAISILTHAVSLSIKNGFTHEAALISRRISEMFQSRGLEDYARIARADAQNHYKRWGANAIVSLHESDQLPEISYSRTIISDALAEINSALSGERTTKGVLGKLVKLASSLSASDNATVILEKHPDITVISYSDSQDAILEKRLPRSDLGHHLPIRAYQHAKSMQVPLIINNTILNKRFRDDSFVLASSTISFMIIPIFRSQAFLGALYIGYTRGADPVSQEEIKLLSILAAQSAYLIENIEVIEEQKSRLVAYGEKERAEEANHAKSMFLAGVSHNMRSPISSINGLAHLIEKTAEDPLVLEHSRNIRTSASGLEDIITGLIDISSSESGELKVRNEIFSLNELIGNIQIVFDNSCGSVDFIAECDRACRDTYIFSDKSKLQQVLINLLTNANKHTNIGYIKLSICSVNLNLNEQTLSLTFSVKDTGSGIDEASLPRIFDRFYSGDNSSGIGLSQGREFVRLLGSDITVNSAVGVGSEFTFTVDVLLADPPTITTTTDTSLQALTKNLEDKNLNILLIEDAPIASTIVKSLLDIPGINIVLKMNGEEGLIAFNSSFDLILVDLRMPVLDGYAVIKKIRDFHKSTVAIACMTAEVITLEECKDMGADYYIGKPFNPQNLYSVVNSVIISLPTNTPPPTLNFQEAISRLGKSHLVRITAINYLSTYEELSSQLDIHIKDDDSKSLADLTHTLKADSAELGGHSLSELASIIYTETKKSPTINDTTKERLIDLANLNNAAMSEIKSEYDL